MIPQEYLPDLLANFFDELVSDESWRGDFSDDERKMLARFMCRWLGHRCAIHPDCSLVEEQSRIRTTLLLFANLSRMLPPKDNPEQNA